MKLLQFCRQGGVFVVVLLSFPLVQAQINMDGITIARINGEPTLEDFAGMAPSTALARSMTRIENFVQRLPDDGEPASQRTEAYIGYDSGRFYAIFLAFDDKSRWSNQLYIVQHMNMFYSHILRSHLAPRVHIPQIAVI